MQPHDVGIQNPISSGLVAGEAQAGIRAEPAVHLDHGLVLNPLFLQLIITANYGLTIIVRANVGLQSWAVRVAEAAEGSVQQVEVCPQGQDVLLAKLHRARIA